jgi:hypothetical protein
MRASFAKIAGATVALLALGWVCVIGIRAQQTASNSGSSTITTNWIGYLVSGGTDTLDRITPSPSPRVVRQIEIGLRSDGVVIWREAPEARAVSIIP